MKELRDFCFINHIVVCNHAIPVDVYVSTPDGISYLEVRIGDDVIDNLTNCDILSRVQQLYTLIYPHIETMSNQCDIVMTDDETIAADDANNLIFKFYGVRKEQ